MDMFFKTSGWKRCFRLFLFALGIGIRDERRNLEWQSEP